MVRTLSQTYLVFLLVHSTLLFGQEPQIIDLHMHSLDPVSFFRSFGTSPTEESTLGYVCKDKEELLAKTLEQMDANGVKCGSFFRVRTTQLRSTGQLDTLAASFPRSTFSSLGIWL